MLKQGPDFHFEIRKIEIKRVGCICKENKSDMEKKSDMEISVSLLSWGYCSVYEFAA